MRLIDAHRAETLLQMCGTYHGVIAYDTVISILHDLPTIEKRKKGKWVGKHERGPFSHPYSITYRCSECEYPIYTLLGTPTLSRYCPNCGAEMKEEK